MLILDRERKMKIFLLCLLVCFIDCLTNGQLEDLQRCESINEHWCRFLPYNLTRLPNLFGQENQKEVNESLWDLARRLNQKEFNETLLDLARRLEQEELNESLWDLAHRLNSLCSEVLLFFACTIHYPICIHNDTGLPTTGPIAPCRSVCEKVKADCTHIPWPEKYNCKKLPTYDDGICMTPTSFVAPNTGGSSSACKNDGRRQLTKNLFRRSSFDFAFKGVLVSITKTSDDNFAMELNVTRVIIPFGDRNNSARIWSQSKCSCIGARDDCLVLKAGKEYVVIGHQDAGKGLSVEHGFILAFPRDRALFERVKKWKKQMKRKE